MSGKRGLNPFFKIYIAGALITAAILIGNGIFNGGLERRHDLSDWIALTAIYIACSALWPILVVIGILQLLGIVRMPITLWG